MDLPAIQSALRDSRLDGWLFYDHHHRDPLAASILSLDPEAHITRRWYYFVPATGDPHKLVHRIESMRLDSLPGTKTEYSSWQELESNLATILSGSMVDAGTVELLRSWGKEIVSSADLVSRFEAVLTDPQIATHFAAQQKIDAILAAAWQHIGSLARAGGIDEFAIVTWLSEAMRREGLVWEHGPNVSCGANSADPH